MEPKLLRSFEKATSEKSKKTSKSDFGPGPDSDPMWVIWAHTPKPPGWDGGGPPGDCQPGGGDGYDDYQNKKWL